MFMKQVVPLPLMVCLTKQHGLQQLRNIMFKLGGEPSGLSNTPTDGAIVKPPYTDSSTYVCKVFVSGYKTICVIDIR